MKKKKKAGMAVGIILLFFIAILAGIIIACHMTMSSFYELHFFPDTYIGSVNVGGWTVDDVKSYYSTAGNERTLTVSGKDGSESVDMDAAELNFTCALDLDSMISSQDTPHWYKHMHEGVRYDEAIDVKYDAEKLERMVMSLNMFNDANITRSTDAKLEKTDDGYAIIPETYGNELSKTDVMTDIKDALSDTGLLLHSFDIPVDVNDDYVLPNVYADDVELTKKLDAITSVENMIINIDMTGATETIGKAEMDEFMIVHDDASITFDENAVQVYIRALARKYCTLHSTRQFKTTAGDIVEIQSDNDSYGFVCDESATQELLMNALKEGNTETTISAVWNDGYCVPKQRKSSQEDIGDTYVEISIDQQHAWYYRDGEIVWDTDCVTGMDVDGRRTPTGIYFIWNMDSPATLTGSYGSAKVTFWMAFTWDGCGLHDASWRNSFGGDIWKTNGSHGCANLPYNKASELYDMLQYNTPVVVYQR